MAPANKTHKKVTNGLVAMSSAAVLAVYSAGYVRTRAAADRFALLEEDRRPDPGTGQLQPDAANGGDGVRLQPDTTEHREVQLLRKFTPGSVRLQGEREPGGERLQSDSPASTPAAATDLSSITSAAPASEAPAALPAAPPTLAPPTNDAQKIADTAIASTTPPKSGYKDGTYLGWGHCRHGDIQARVVIADGRIASATIATCLTRYSCSVIERLPPEVAQRQSPDVDSISGATQSGDAFYYAVLDALYLAK